MSDPTPPPVRVVEDDGDEYVEIAAGTTLQHELEISVAAPSGMTEGAKAAAILHALSQPRVPEGMTHRLRQMATGLRLLGNAWENELADIADQWADALDTQGASPAEHESCPDPSCDRLHVSPETCRAIEEMLRETRDRLEHPEEFARSTQRAEPEQPEHPDGFAGYHGCPSTPCTGTRADTCVAAGDCATLALMDRPGYEAPTANVDEPEPPAPATERIPWQDAFRSGQPIRWPAASTPTPIARAERNSVGEVRLCSERLPLSGGRFTLIVRGGHDGMVEVLVEAQESDVVMDVAIAIAEVSGESPERTEAEAAITAYRKALGCGDDDVLVPVPREWAQRFAAAEAHLLAGPCRAALDREKTR